MKSIYYITILVLIGLVKYNPVKSKIVETSHPQGSIISNITHSVAQNINSLMIIPGERVGEITANTNREQLAELFPPNVATLQDVEVPLSEGMTAIGTKVEISKENQFTIIWKNEEKSQVEKIVNFGSAWNLPEGVHVNTTWKVLQEKLGEFQLFGFRWDYGGTLQLEGTPLEEYKDYLIIRVAPSLEAISSNTEALNAVSGERLIESKNPNLQQLNLKVSEIIVIFKK
jgi:hypothetical protein